MFTSLGAGFDLQLTPNQTLSATTATFAEPLGDTQSFSLTLDTSLETGLTGGELLPADGSILPPALDLRLQVDALKGQNAGRLAPEDLTPAAAVVPEHPAGDAPEMPAAESPLIGIVDIIARQSSPEEQPIPSAGGLGNFAAPTPGGNADEPVPPTPANPAPVPRPAADAAAPPVLRRPSGQGTTGPEVTLPADMLTNSDEMATDPRVARLTELNYGTVEPVARPAVAPGPAAELPVELAVYRPAATALPEAAAAASADGSPASAISANSTEGLTRTTPRLTVMPPISTPVTQSDWGESLSERVLTMTTGKLANAEIRLTPAELGPVRVQLSVEEGTASVAFQASHAATREAIEQALPRLRDMLSENGIALGQTSVGEQGLHDGGQETSDEPAAAGQLVGGGSDDGAADSIPEEQVVRISSALVDTFA